MTKEIMTGVFIADGADRESALTYAETSATIYATGKIQTNTLSSDNTPLDEVAEYSLDINSPEMTAARADMREAVKGYAHLRDTDPERFEALAARDAIIIKEKYYGSYDADFINSAETSAKAQWDSSGRYERDEPTVNIDDIERDGLICRQMAPVCSNLLHEVGIETANVTSGVMFHGKDEAGYHAYLVSTRTGNIIEATGRADTAEFAYNRTMTQDADNWKKILEGGLIVTEDGDVYGTGTNDGSIDKGITSQKALALRSSSPSGSHKQFDSIDRWYSGEFAESKVDRTPVDTDALAGKGAAVETAPEPVKPVTTPVKAEEVKPVEPEDKKGEEKKAEEAKKSQSQGQEAEGLGGLGALGVFLTAIIALLSGEGFEKVIEIFQVGASKDEKDKLKEIPEDARKDILAAAKEKIEELGIEGGVKGFVEKAAKGEISEDNIKSVMEAASEKAKEHGIGITGKSLEEVAKSEPSLNDALAALGAMLGTGGSDVTDGSHVVARSGGNVGIGPGTRER